MSRTWNVYVTQMRLHRKRVCRYLPKGRSEFHLHLRQTVFRLTARGRVGICVTAAWRQGERLLGEQAAMELWRWPSMAIKKREVAKSDVQHLAAVETTRFADLMPLIEHCALRKYEDGSDREPGWLVLKVTGAAWVVQVKDPDSCTSFAAVADTVDKAVETAALLLACDEAPWERDVWLEKSKAEKLRKK